MPSVFFVRGYSAGGDGGYAFMSPDSEVFRSSAGAGVLVDGNTPRRALGVTSNVELAVVDDSATVPDGRAVLR